MIYMAVSLSVTVIAVALLAYDIARRTIEVRNRGALALEQLAKVEKDLAEHRAAYATLCKDWRSRFSELENEWKSLREHANSQYAGAVAQVNSMQSSGGFNRR
jgi:hypothetical protein